jgi:hypothetical protein
VLGAGPKQGLLIGEVPVDGQALHARPLGDRGDRGRERSSLLVQRDRGRDNSVPGLPLALGSRLELELPAFRTRYTTMFTQS